MKIEVAYATAQQQVIVALDLPPSATVGEAVTASGLLARFPAIDLRRDGVGVFGERRTLSDHLRDGDRVEIYRPLMADPKEARRRRARAGKSKRRRLGS